MIKEFEITKLDARLVKQIENAQNAVSTDIAYTFECVFTSIRATVTSRRLNP